MIHEASSDEELLEEMADEPMALEMIYQRFGARWASLIRAAGVSGQDVPDVIQHVLIEVWRHHRRFDRQKGRADTWLFAIVRHRTIDFVRRRHPETTQWSEEFNQLQTSQDPIECKHWIDAAMIHLSENEQRVLHLIYYGGFTATEIARMWHVPSGTVKSWVSRGLKKLRQQLAEERRS